MTVSKAQQKAVHKYQTKNYDQVNLLLYKGERDILKSVAKEKGMSVNALVRKALVDADLLE